MKEITIKELFHLLRELTESENNRCLFIKPDCSLTRDAIVGFACTNEKIRVRTAYNNGRIEPQHRVLLDANLDFYDNHEALFDDISKYENDDISKVFVVEPYYNGPVPDGMEVYTCRDYNAMTVGEVIDKLEAIEDKQAVIVCKQSDMIGTHFLNPSHNGSPTKNHVTLQAFEDESYPVQEILEALKGCDREPIFMVMVGTDCVVYNIEVHESNEQGCCTVYMDCRSATDLIRLNEN